MQADLRLLRGQAGLIEKGAEAFKSEPPPGPSVQVLDDLIEEALGMERQARRALDRAWHRLHSEARFPAQDVGRHLLRSLRAAVASMRALAEMVRQAKEKGDRVEKVAQLREAKRALLQQAKQFRQNWPLFKPADVQAASERVKQGKGVTLAEAKRELGLGD